MKDEYFTNLKMTIVSNYLPRFDVGSSNTRVYHLIKLLSSMGVKLTYIYFYNSQDNERYEKAISEAKTVLLNGSPHEHVRNILASKPDILWLTNLWSPIFFESMSRLMDAVRTRRPEVKIILDTMDLHAKKYHRRYAITRSPDDLFTAKKFLDLEKSNYPKADAVVVVTEDEKNDILALKLDSPSIHVIPNIHQISADITPYDQRSDLVYLGNFNINHNVDAVLHFVKAIFPYISKKYPKLRLHILGREADTKLRQLASQTICVHGFVQDLEKAMAQFRIFICPMTYGAGMKGKLGEAMANGLPIVTTTIGAEGFALIDGENCFIANSPEEFAQKTIELYEDEVLWNNFSTKCRYLIQKNYSYEQVAKHLKDLILSFKPANLSLIHKQNGADFTGKHLKTSMLTSNVCTPINKIESYLLKINWQHKLPNYSSHFDYAKIINDKESPLISVIIISWRLHPETARTLQILRKQRTQPFELIFIDNGSDLGTFDVLIPDIDTYVRLNNNSGAYLARNIGSIFSKAPILFFLDDDAIPADNIIESHLNCFNTYDVIAVRGVCMPKSNNPLNQLAKHYYLGPKPFPIYADIEGNTSYLASTFFKAGGWDDEIRFGGGGVDLSRRLLDIEADMRKQIYSPDPIIFHDYAEDNEHLTKKRQKQIESHQRLKAKHHDYDIFLSSWNKLKGRNDILLKNPANEIYDHTQTTDLKLNASSLNLLNNKMILISICIPTYNRDKFIYEAIQSSLAQKYPFLEIVIVDDGSTDRTESIVKSFDSKLIKYVKKEHTNSPDTRNRCIAEAKGDYILWLDSDDILSPNILEKYAETLNTYPDLDILICYLNVFSDNGRIIRTSTPNDWHNDNKGLLLYFLEGNPLRNPGALIKKSIYEEIGYYDTKFKRGHDYEFWSRVAISGNYKCKTVKEPLCFYRVHQNTLTGDLHQIKTDFIFEQQVISNILKSIDLTTLFYKFDWSNDFINSYKNATVKIVQRFLEINGLHLAIDQCKNGIIKLQGDNDLRKIYSELYERKKDFENQYVAITKLSKMNSEELISYTNFLLANLGSKKPKAKYSSDQEAIEVLQQQAVKYINKNELLISLYLHFALIEILPKNKEILLNISEIKELLNN